MGLGSGIRDPGSGKNLFRISDSGSATLIFLYPYSHHLPFSFCSRSTTFSCPLSLSFFLFCSLFPLSLYSVIARLLLTTVFSPSLLAFFLCSISSFFSINVFLSISLHITPMIYTFPYVMLLMRANTLRGQVGGGFWAL
jgi:hypothetical protein